MAQQASWNEQWNNVLQLSKDRKNAIGGYHQSVKDFPEMGAVAGGHWTLSNESLVRSHGTPVDPKDPESEWKESIKGWSHNRLEEEIKWLDRTSSDLYTAYQAVFSPDHAGDSDYDQLKKQAQEFEELEQRIEHFVKNVSLPRVNLHQHSRERVEGARKMREEARKDLLSMLARKKYLAGQQLLFERVNAALKLLTHRLWQDDLLVEYARLRTKDEDRTMEQRNESIYQRFLELTEEWGDKPEVAYRTIMKETGLSDRRAKEIVQKRREAHTGEKRPRGRPKRAS